MLNLICPFYFLIIEVQIFTINKFGPHFIQTVFLQLNAISEFLANTSHKLIIAFKPLIDGLSKVASSA